MFAAVRHFVVIHCNSTFISTFNLSTLSSKQRVKYLMFFLHHSVLWCCWFGGRKGIRPVKKPEWWGTGMVVCLERGADLHMAQLMPLPLTVSCFSKIQIDFTFLVPAHLGSPGQRAVKRMCVCVLHHLVLAKSFSRGSKQKLKWFRFKPKLLSGTAYLNALCKFG